MADDDRFEHKIHQLTRMIEVSCLLTSKLDLSALLQRVVDAAVELTNAEMGGMLVLDEKHEKFEYFKVSGWPLEPKGFPTGKGILGIPYETGVAIMEEDVRKHPKAIGTPAGHPDIASFIAVPLIVRDRALGSLFVGNKPGDKVFSDDDKFLLSAFASQAAVVIENTRLYKRSEEMVVYEERRRIAQSLHETVVQYLFTIGLEAEHCRLKPEDCERQLETIRRLAERASEELRSAIFALSSSVTTQYKALPAILGDLVEAFENKTATQISLLLPDELPEIQPMVVEAIYRITREALSNIQKHAHATAVVITLTINHDSLALAIQDNGRGIDTSESDGLHFGLLTMQQVAKNAQGEIYILKNEDDVGTVVRAEFPFVQGA